MTKATTKMTMIQSNVRFLNLESVKIKRRMNGFVVKYAINGIINIALDYPLKLNLKKNGIKILI